PVAVFGMHLAIVRSFPVHYQSKLGAVPSSACPNLYAVKFNFQLFIGHYTRVACSSGIGTSANPALHIAVSPSNWLRILIAVTDVPHQLSVQIWNGSEYASRDHIAFDFTEPKLNLVQP